MPRTYCSISHAALRHNLQRVRQLRPEASILAMVKADAYGHGLVEVAKALQPGVEALGVAVLDEAIVLRQAGIKIPVVLMQGVFSLQELAAARIHDLQLVVHQQRQLDWLLQTPGTPLTIWLKVNTGMNRLGFRPEMLPGVWSQLQQATAVRQIILMTHLAMADMPTESLTSQQHHCFMACQQSLGIADAQTSLCNSAGILAWPQLGGHWVRPGLMLYGASPFAAQCAADLQLQPVMRLYSRVMAIQQVRAGEIVGYAGCWQAKEDQRIAIVSCGYGDGYPRTAPSGTPVAIEGAIYPLAGRVSMDMLAVDIGHAPVSVDAEVELWGEQVPVDAVAAAAGTLAYELFCKVTDRVPFYQRIH